MEKPSIRLVWVTRPIPGFSGARSRERKQAMVDIPALVRLVQSELEHGNIARELANALREPSSVRKQVQKKSQFVLAYDGKKLVGFVEFVKDSPREFVRSLMFVDPGYRKMGIGKRLHYAVNAFARHAGASMVASGAATQEGKQLIQSYFRSPRKERRNGKVFSARETYVTDYSQDDLPTLRVTLIPRTRKQEARLPHQPRHLKRRR